VNATESREETPETGSALVHLGTVVGMLALFATATYAMPFLERARPWVSSDDGVPLARLFEQYGEVPAFAGAGGAYSSETRVTERTKTQLGGAVAANLGSDDDLAASQPTPPPAREDRGQAPPAIRIDPREYEGIEQTIESPQALRPFFEALERTAQRRDGAITRVAHYGDSSIATDLITHTVRRRMQRRFGDAGHGFVLIARGTMPYGHRDVRHRAGEDWQLRQITAAQDRNGLYGYGGVAYQPSGTSAWARFATAEDAPVGGNVGEFQVFFRRHPSGGRIRYQVDDGETREIDTRGEHGDAVEVISVADGEHELELRAGGGGPVRLYGVALERDVAGVVYDSLGLVGARARRLLNYDAEHIGRQMALREPSLLVLGFGGNEADDPVHRVEGYEEEFVEVIRRMRAGREEMACLVFAPLDQARRDENGRVETLPAIPLIVQAQRAAALREGCAFYDTFQAMGGEGAMGNWARARPRLALSDYRHATPAGYEVIGNMFYKALLQAFAQHLD
jgi:lysophospholipase L1-like esterase